MPEVLTVISRLSEDKVGRLLMVGDSYQLGPLAKEKGTAGHFLGESILYRFCKQNNLSFEYLSYRCTGSLLEWPSTTTYQRWLTRGLANDASAQMLPLLPPAEQHFPGPAAHTHPRH